MVNASAPLFTYAAVIDGRTADPIFVVGANNDAGTPTTDTTTDTDVVRRAGPDPDEDEDADGRTEPDGDVHADPHAHRAGSDDDAHAPRPQRDADADASGPTVTPTAPGPSVTPTATAATTSTPTFTITVPPTIRARRRRPRFPIRSTSAGGLIFSPQTITINAGRNGELGLDGRIPLDDVGHGRVGFGVALARPFTFSHTFNTQGTFPYHCTVHGSRDARNGHGQP